MELSRTTRPRTPWIITAAAVVVAAAVVTTMLLLAGRDGDAPQAAPDDGRLPDATALGVTDLSVQDLATVSAYYRDAIGLTVLEETADTVLLGRGTPILRLTASDDAPADARDAGLYHTAIVYTDASTLAETLVSVAENAPQSYQGSADHAVSLAFYLGDPEGNGVELYVDRPRDEWVWVDGQVQMGSAALDPNQFIDDHLGAGTAGSASIGHMHLKVGDLDEARTFYADTLGFDVVAEAEGALFYSAGGYHHHIATNVWQSSGAGVRTTEIGLGAISVVLPDVADVETVSARVSAAGHDVAPIDGGVRTTDPWGNVVRITAAG